MKPKLDRRTLIWSSLAATLVLALALVLALFSWNWLRGPIGWVASIETGRRIRLNGDLKVRPWSWTPTATIGDLEIGDPAGLDDGDLARVPTAILSVDVPRLLVGQLDLPLIDLEQPLIRLYRDPSERSNWRGGGRAPPRIERFIIRGGLVSMVDRPRALKLTGTVESSEPPGQAQQGAFRFDGRGTLRGAPIGLSLHGGALLNVQAGQPYPFDADLSSGATRLVLHGQLARRFAFTDLSATVTASGPDLQQLYALTGVVLPETPPYALTAQMVRSDGRYTFNPISGRIGASDLEGSLAVWRQGQRRDLRADLTSRRLRMADLGPLAGAPPKSPATPAQAAEAARLHAEQHILPDARLNVARLGEMDAVVRYRAESVEANPHLPLRQLAARLTLDHGLLTMDPLSVSLPRGSLAGSIRLDARGATPVTDVDLALSNADLQNFFRASASPPLQGAVFARARLRGYGASVHEAASNANGDLALVVPHGQIRQAFAELLGIDVAKGLGLLLTGNKQPTDVRCAVADFHVTNGKMLASHLVLDTGVVLAQGQGQVDLRSEAVDLKLVGQPKKLRLLRVSAPITLKGQIEHPKLGIEPGKAPIQAAAAVALGAFLTPLAAILPFIDPVLAHNADCGALITQAADKGAPVGKPAAQRITPTR